MINDLSKYRLNDDRELDRFSSKDPVRFLQFQCDVYNMLDGLVPGERINVIDVCKPTSVEVFIKVVCRYILNHQNDGFTKSHIEFSEDYRQIYRRPGMPETKPHWNHFYSKK